MFEKANERFRVLWLSSELMPIMLIAFLVCVMYSPLLFDGQMFSGDERLDSFYQHGIFYSEALRNGESFLWNPHTYGGFPTYVDQMLGFYFPPVYVLFSFFPPLLAFHIEIAFATFVGLVFAYLLGRAFNLSRSASLIVALCYASAQMPASFSLGLSYVHSFALLPMLLYAIILAKKSSTYAHYIRAIMLGGIAVATGILAGYIVTVIYTFVFAGFFAFSLDLWGGRFGFAKNIRACTALGISIVIGLVAGFPQLIALLEYSPFTARTAEFAREAAVGSGVGLIDFVRWVLPYEFQFPLDTGRGYFYIGVLPLLAVCVALSRFRDPFVVIFASIYAIFLGFAMNAPIFEWINVNVPPFSHIAGVSRWLLVGSIAPALLAGYGFDRMTSAEHLSRCVTIERIFVIIAGAGLLIFSLLQFALQFAKESREIQFLLFEKVLALKGRSVESLQHPIDHYLLEIVRQLDGLHIMFSFRNSDFTAFIVFALGALVVVSYVTRAKHVMYASFAATTLVIAGLVFSFKAALGNTMPVAAYFEREPVAAQVMKSKESNYNAYRFAAFQGEELSRLIPMSTRSPWDGAILMRELLYREVGTAYGLNNISGFQPIRSIRQNQLINAALGPETETVIDSEAIRSGMPIDRYLNGDILTPVSPDEKGREIENRVPLLSMMNVKYILSLYPLSDERLVPISFEKVPEMRVDYYLYENKAALPKVYFAAHPKMWSGTERDLLIAMLETRDFTKNTYIECAGCSIGGGGGRITITREENGLVLATTTSRTDGWLIYSETNLPGWIAKVDAVRVPIRTANYLFQSIEVPSGEHEIEFRYVGSFALFLEKIGLRNL